MMGRKRQQDDDRIASVAKKLNQGSSVASPEIVTTPSVAAAKTSVTPVRKPKAAKGDAKRKRGATALKSTAITQELIQPTEQECADNTQEPIKPTEHSATITEEHNIKGSSVASPAIVTQTPYVAAAKTSVTPVRKPKAAKGDAKKRGGATALKSTAITQELIEPTERECADNTQDCIKPTEHSATITEEHYVTVSQSTNSSTQVNAKKHPKRKNFCLEPQGKSWLPHIAGRFVHRLMTTAKSLGIDPLSQPESICTKQGIFSEEDMRIMCQYISKQYPEHSVQSILSELEPYATLTEENIIKHNVEMKYKDIIPKPPVTSYLLFYQRKHGAIKTKYPNLKATEVSQKIGMKWKKLKLEKKKLYIKEYNRLKEEYKVKLEQFYAEHPDALPRKKSKSTSATHLQMLKKLAPKCIQSACALFCRENREAMQLKHPELKPAEITVCLRSDWIHLTKEEKATFEQQFEQMKNEYESKMEQFVRDHPDAEELFQMKSSKKAELLQMNDDATPVMINSLPVPAKDDDDDDDDDNTSEDEDEMTREDDN